MVHSGVPATDRCWASSHLSSKESVEDEQARRKRHVNVSEMRQVQFHIDKENWMGKEEEGETDTSIVSEMRQVQLHIDKENWMDKEKKKKKNWVCGRSRPGRTDELKWKFAVRHFVGHWKETFWTLSNVSTGILVLGLSFVSFLDLHQKNKTNTRWLWHCWEGSSANGPDEKTNP